MGFGSFEKMVESMWLSQVNFSIRILSTTTIETFSNRFPFLFSLESIFVNMDGKLLARLYQMKKSAEIAYYKTLHYYFRQNSKALLSDELKFDLELENLFQ